MDTGLVLAVLLAIAFATTNGLHDASNAIATLVATRAAKPSQAIVLAAAFNLLGPFVIGAAVADTIAGIVTVPPEDATAVIGAGLAAAVGWNLVTWYSGPALELGKRARRRPRWRRADRGRHRCGQLGRVRRPCGPWASSAASSHRRSPPRWAPWRRLLVIRALRRRRAAQPGAGTGPGNGGQWGMSAALAFSHGANDAQKSIGVIAALLLAAGEIRSFARRRGRCSPPRRRSPLARPLADGGSSVPWAAASTGSSRWRASPARALGGRDLRRLAARRPDLHHAGRRFVARRDRRRTGPLHHVHWLLVRRMGFAWLVTIPITALLAMGAYEVWSWVA